jgi:hypothetical protein
MDGGRKFRLRRWSPRDQATRAAMQFYIHLCLEGLPLHLWSESFAEAIMEDRARCTSLRSTPYGRIPLMCSS